MALTMKTKSGLLAWRGKYYEFFSSSDVCAHNPALQWSDAALFHSLKSHHVWDQAHKIVFCPIAKVASSSWFVNFLNMSGVENSHKTISRLLKSKEKRSPGRGVRRLVHKLYQPPPDDNLGTILQTFNQMTGFMLVRHPFERLMSAYEDKILNPQPHFDYHFTVQRQIKERRKKADVKIDFPEDLYKEKFATKFKGKVF